MMHMISKGLAITDEKCVCKAALNFGSGFTDGFGIKWGV